MAATATIPQQLTNQATHVPLPPSITSPAAAHQALSSSSTAGQFIVPCQALWGSRPPPSPPQPFDASHCHPVFFTNKLRRPLFGALLSGPQASPVAHGYVYRDGMGTSGSRL
ncbi:hypothetical protein VTJ04DRAFT_4653 [Mycothermus thermophilus]|uniref:uncharacterized protein n=1 Tax=Humicola insolens TaxID=85995 RepID=UPI003744ACC6